MYTLDIQLPVEVVGIIAHHLVCAGINDAWKLRGLCGPFRCAIEDDILLRQRKDVLQDGAKIMCHLLPRYLAHRIRSPLDVNTVLPNRIKSMHTFVCKLMECDPSMAQNHLLDKLCKGVVAMTGTHQITNLLWRDEHEMLEPHLPKQYQRGPWVSELASLQTSDKVVAAMAIGAHDDVRKLLPQLDDRHFDYKGHGPLAAAVILNDSILLHTVLEYLATFGPFGDISWKGFGVIHAIEVAIHCRAWDFVVLILDHIGLSGTRSCGEVYNMFLRACCHYRNIDAIRAICRLRPYGRQAISPAIFTEIVALGDMESFNLLLPAVKLNSGTIKSLPLHIAIRGHNLEMVGALLQAGADINLRTYKGSKSKKKKTRDYKCPIEVAMGQGAAEVEFLLQRGASIPHFSRWNIQSHAVYMALRDGATVRDAPHYIPQFREIWEMTEEEFKAFKDTDPWPGL